MRSISLSPYKHTPIACSIWRSWLAFFSFVIVGQRQDYPSRNTGRGASRSCSASLLMCLSWSVVSSQGRTEVLTANVGDALDPSGQKCTAFLLPVLATLGFVHLRANF